MNVAGYPICQAELAPQLPAPLPADIQTAMGSVMDVSNREAGDFLSQLFAAIGSEEISARETTDAAGAVEDLVAGASQVNDKALYFEVDLPVTDTGADVSEIAQAVRSLIVGAQQPASLPQNGPGSTNPEEQLDIEAQQPTILPWKDTGSDSHEEPSNLSADAPDSASSKSSFLDWNDHAPPAASPVVPESVSRPHVTSTVLGELEEVASSTGGRWKLQQKASMSAAEVPVAAAARSTPQQLAETAAVKETPQVLSAGEPPTRPRGELSFAVRITSAVSVPQSAGSTAPHAGVTGDSSGDGRKSETQLKPQLQRSHQQPAGETADSKITELASSNGAKKDSSGSGQPSGQESSTATGLKSRSDDTVKAPNSSKVDPAAGVGAHPPISIQGASADAMTGAQTGATASKESPANTTQPEPASGAEKMLHAGSPAREINMRIPGRADAGVDIQVVERGGKLHVAVRTPASDLATTLRDGIGSLVQRIEHQGFRAEAWTPGSESQHASTTQVKDVPAADTGSSNQDGGSRGQQQSSQQNQQQQQRSQPGWLQELEKLRQESNPGKEEIAWLPLLKG